MSRRLQGRLDQRDDGIQLVKGGGEAHRERLTAQLKTARAALGRCTPINQEGFISNDRMSLHSAPVVLQQANGIATRCT